MGSTRHTTYNLSAATTSVRVTRRHHPLFGQKLEVVRPLRVSLIVALGDGSHLKLPRAWTDIDGGAEPAVEATISTVDGLRLLLRLVAAMQERT